MEAVHRLLWCTVVSLLFVALAAVYNTTRKD